MPVGRRRRRPRSAMPTCTRSSRRHCSSRPSASSRASCFPSERSAGKNNKADEMALIEVKVPQLSESVAEATLLQWKKKPGQAVAMDEILIEIETDKVVLEVPAPAAGVLAQVLKNDGDSCIGEEVIAKIDTEGQETVSDAMQIRSVPPAQPAPGETPGVSAKVAAAAETKSEIAMPAAAKLM